MSQPDVVIIGSGMGGATLAAALAPSGRHIVVLERGDALTPRPQDRNAQAIFGDGFFRSDEHWLDGDEQPFNPGNYYNLGGNSKFYGAVLIRYRRHDFEPVMHRDGITPSWPISYDTIEPWYQAAEELYQVRGTLDEDPTEPEHSGDYPHAPVPDEADIADLRTRLKSLGLHPASLPLGVDLERWLAGGQTTWDAYPNTGQGKMDAETIGLAQVKQYPNVEIKTRCQAHRLVEGENGTIDAVEVTQNGQRETIKASLFVVAAGAVQSAALLLASANDNNPNGLANSSGQLGRNFMNHNCSAVMALHPLRKNRAIYQKTLMLNDFYVSDGEGGPPLGNVQMLGKITGPILASQSPLPAWLAGWVAARSFDFYAMSEDLPNPDSRVTLHNGQIKLDWQRSNWGTHLALVSKLKSVLRKAGFPIVVSRPFDRRTPSHQCGTARMGNHSDTSVVNPFCRSHDHANLFVVDASVLPTSAAVNPALTIAALALRTGQHIQETDWAA